ncbi:MAG: vWA domain-containing protein [Bacteroidota bacterium]
MTKTFMILLSITIINMACITHTEPSMASAIGLENTDNQEDDQKASRIQVAILLDTSSSMDGLINQAKSQLWKMVNELAVSKKNGVAPDIEIALYDYGNSTISASNGYVRQIIPLTRDLDLVSEKLFSLTTQGGDEYCGRVIQEATNVLEWTGNHNDLQLIFIAGNEPFTQGPVDYRDACKNAIEQGIIVNTIHCGDYQVGVRTNWKDGADLADGKYLNIDQDDEVVHIPTPFDDEIMRLNQSLNQTYIGYGSLGATNLERQAKQDANAGSFGSANTVERAVAKSKRSLYKNTEWDLVDAVEEDAEVMEELEEEQLPEEMRNMSAEERKAYVEEKAEERSKIQDEINELDKKRKAFISEERKTNAEKLTLDNVMLETVRSQAKEKNFKFEE